MRYLFKKKILLLKNISKLYLIDKDVLSVVKFDKAPIRKYAINYREEGGMDKRIVFYDCFSNEKGIPFFCKRIKSENPFFQSDVEF